MNVSGFWGGAMAELLLLLLFEYMAALTDRTRQDAAGRRSKLLQAGDRLLMSPADGRWVLALGPQLSSCRKSLSFSKLD